MAQWLRHPPTERGIPGSNPGVIDLSFFFLLFSLRVTISIVKINISSLSYFNNGRMAQWLRHPPTERGIPGSNPGVIDSFFVHSHH